MIEIKGKSGIVAKILADSVNEQGNRLTTFELTYARLIHSELLTHKMLCSNSASSRAIPFAKMAEQLTARPVRFGQANPGMQDKGCDYNASVLVPGSSDISWNTCWYELPDEGWETAKRSALSFSKAFYDAGYHKQVYNRIIEPFQMMKTVISGTEWDNFFWLRNDSAADPTLHELARCMQEARDESVPQLLKAGEWHLPYIDKIKNKAGDTLYGDFIPHSIEPAPAKEFTVFSLEDAIKVSCSRTAAVSFRNEDYGLEKCMEVYSRLIGDERKHSSAMQHAATPMKEAFSDYIHSEAYETQVNYSFNPDSWEQGISHVDREGNLWSAQYKGFVMHRKTIPGENYVNG